jgi:hypothetical protein
VLTQRIANDYCDGKEERRDEDRDCDVSAFKLRGEIYLWRNPVNDAIADVHQNHAKNGIRKVEHDYGQLHNSSGSLRSRNVTHRKHALQYGYGVHRVSPGLCAHGLWRLVPGVNFPLSLRTGRAE